MTSPGPVPDKLIPNQLTVILPNRNHGHYIATALHAIFSQSLKPNRVVVVDDQSSDNSIEVIESVRQKHPELELICNEARQGVLKTCNQWLSRVETEFLYFASADDFILPGFFESTTALLSTFPLAPVCSAFTHHIDSDGNDISIPDPYLDQSEPHFIEPKDALEKFIRLGNFLPGNTSLHRTVALRAVGGFAEDLRAFGDGYALTVAAAQHGVCVVPKRLATMRHLDTGISGTMVQDMEGSLEILDKALVHMTKDFPGLFPKRFLYRFGARWRYGLVLEAFSRDATRDDLFRALGSSNILDKITLGIVHSLGKAGKALPRRLLWAWMCPFDVLPAIKAWIAR